MKKNEIRKQTIQDFGNQWKIHGDLNSGYWTSIEILENIVGPLLNLKDVEGKIIAEVGSGSGRLISIFSRLKPKHIYSIEPSFGIEKQKMNLNGIENITFINQGGEYFDISGVDLIYSIGVIHHIIEPQPVLLNIKKSLKPGGKFLIWVYGKEGNLCYLLFYKMTSWLTKNSPDYVLNIFSQFLNILLVPYIFLCKFIKLPLRDYLINIFSKCTFQHRKYIIFDQLNPKYAKYYTKQDLLDLLEKSGFKNIKIYHRNSYSWTAICEN